MIEFQLQLSDLEINYDDIYLNLGYGGTVPDEHIDQMLESAINKAYDICRPRAGFVLCIGKLLDRHTIQLANISMKIGQIINGYLEQSTQFGLFVATAGKEYDDYLHEIKLSGDIMSEFLADAVGSEIAEAAVRFVTQKIADEAALSDLYITNSYSPGYCGWHVREQKQLFSLLPAEPCGIKLNDSCLMHPVKSVSGMVGIGSEVRILPYSCNICGLSTCYKRKQTSKTNEHK
ncbi:MAG: 5-methyltetrahydrofolate--homocysteine methyltransferase [Paludibacter sp.]|nr:5-methyltetrahydrofolate--homocysteine methyltransferase [Paludibacter sp.]